MRKAASLFLLCIFLFNTVGYYIAFMAVQYEVKTEMESKIRSGVNTDGLTMIAINKKDLSNIEWTERNEEMRYKGELYDVVKSAETNASVTFYCINDSKENTLFTTLDEHINMHIATNKSIKNESSKKVMDTLIKIYFSNASCVNFIDFSPDTSFPSANLIYTAAVIKISPPPPQFV